MKFAVQLLLSTFVAGTLAIPTAETVTLIPVTISKNTSATQVQPPTGWPQQPDEPLSTTSSPIKTTSSKPKTTSTSTTTSKPGPARPPPMSSSTSTSTTSDDGGISYTSCPGRRPCGEPPKTKTTSTKPAPPPVTSAPTNPPPVANCPTVTTTATACNTCLVPGCTEIATITNPCGCPRSPATVGLNLGCAVRDVCDLIGCKTLYRVASERC